MDEGWFEWRQRKLVFTSRVFFMVRVGIDFDMSHRRSVALLVETSNAYSRGLLEGVIAYNKQHANWSMFIAEQEQSSDKMRSREN